MLALFSRSTRATTRPDLIRYNRSLSSRTPGPAMTTIRRTTRTMPAALPRGGHRSNVIFHRNRPETDRKRRAISAAGLDSLHVVLDFDHTLTAYLSPDGGEKCPECHDVLQHGPYWPSARRESFRAAIDAIWADQRSGMLGSPVEWWIRFHDAVVAHGITEDEMREAAREAHVSLRPGAAELLAWLNARGVRTTIVSAGVSTVIEEVFERHGVELHQGAAVIANVPVWDRKGRAVSFEDPLICSRNKAEVLRGMGFGGEAGTGGGKVRNVVLAGNSVGDAACLLGMRHGHSLSFGFLHEEVEDFGGSGPRFGQDRSGLDSVLEDGTERPPQGNGSPGLENFLEHYDVVTCGYRSDFSYLMKLLQEIENSKEYS